MQKWWLIGAGVVGVGLAVLLLGRPLDTGEDVAPLGDVDIVLVEGEGAQPGELVRGPDGRVIEDADVTAGRPVPVITERPGSRTAMVRPGVRPVDPSQLIQGANPSAMRAAARRDTPEARLAAQTTAPWTQIRREIAKAAGDDPNASELIGEVQTIIDDLRVTQRDPQSVDFDDIRQHQDAVISRVKESPYYNSEVEQMLQLLDQRNSEYKSGM